MEDSEVPYIIEKKTEIKLAIFVILFPLDNAFFVWKTPENNLKKTYQHHYYGENKKTKQLFLKAKSANTLPPIYCLEILNTTHEEAFLHCIAWTKYFLNQGLFSLSGKHIEKYINNLTTETQQIYDAIKSKKLEQICALGEDLFPNYGKERKRNNALEKNIITFRVKESEYQQIKNAADKSSLSISQYCKKAILKGQIVHIDQEIFSLLSQSLNEFTNRNQLLRNILSAIYLTGTYYPADLEIIQSAIEDNAKLQNEYMANIKDVIKSLLK